MSDAPTSAAEVAPAWTEADAAWEELQRRAVGAPEPLRRRCRLEALEITRQPGFGRAGDPRRATSLTHRALAAEAADLDEALGEALAAWDASPAWAAGMVLPPRARSSLFHLRLEAKHPSAYTEAQRSRVRARLIEARGWTEAAARGGPRPAPPSAGQPGTLPPGDLRRLEGALAFLG
jgi:hypothetical protein